MTFVKTNMKSVQNKIEHQEIRLVISNTCNSFGNTWKTHLTLELGTEAFQDTEIAVFDKEESRNYTKKHVEIEYGILESMSVAKAIYVIFVINRYWFL